MRKNYVPRTLGEFLGESKSITLKRKYGERPAVNVGTNAPLRNQVLSFIAESGSVSKTELKKFIIGLKESSTPVAANMFISRNAQYFITESKNGNTMFRLSNLGARLVDQFVDESEHNISESVKEARNRFSSILENARQNRLNERFVEDKDVDGDIDDEDENEHENYTVEETPEEIIFTFQKDGDEDEDDDDDFEDEDEDEDDIDLEDEDEDEDESEETSEEEPNYDFKDKKGRPGITDELDEAQVARMKKMIKNLRLNEAEGEEADELSDKDVDKDEEADDTAETDDTNTDDINLENETEKVEITEFIITVDDVDSAIEELGALGVTAEKIPVEVKQEEVPVEDETEDLTPPPAEGAPAPEATQEQKNESLKRFVANMLNEAAEASDELGLGDQGEVTSELDAQPAAPAADPNAAPVTPAAPATEEYEQNKIKVNAQDWDVLKGWLEEKGVNVQEMFGGEIETEDIDPDQPEGAPVSDEEIDFTGIGDDDDTEVKVEDKEED